MAPETFDDRISQYLVDSDHFNRSYDDPALWLRLQPAVEAEMSRAIAALVATKIPDYPTYTERFGYLRALDWVLREAAHITRKERQE